jgi:hypothetical protein
MPGGPEGGLPPSKSSGYSARSNCGQRRGQRAALPRTTRADKNASATLERAYGYCRGLLKHGRCERLLRWELDVSRSHDMRILRQRRGEVNETWFGMNRDEILETAIQKRLAMCIGEQGAKVNTTVV